MNLILEKSKRVPYYTDLRTIIRALGVSAANYDWYVSDLNFMGFSQDTFSQADRWVTGEELESFIEENEVQFCWGVFSAIGKGVRFEVCNPPYADGNAEFWTKQNVRPQLKTALFEIVCWDSGATLLIGLPPALANSFLSIYPEARNLNTPPS